MGSLDEIDPGAAMPVPESILEITETLYEAITGRRQWIESFAHMCAAFDSTFAFVTTCREADAVHPGLGSVQAEDLDPYLARWNGADPRMLRFVSSARDRRGRLLSDCDLFSPDELADSQFHDFMRQRGHGDFLGFCERVAGQDYFFAMGLPIGRSVTDLPWGVWVRRVGRHFIRAVSTWSALEGAGALAEAMMIDGCGSDRGIVVLDEAHRVLHMNAAATRLLQGGYTLSAGRLRFKDQAWHAAVVALVAGVTRPHLEAGRAGPLALESDAGGLPLLVSAAPLPMPRTHGLSAMRGVVLTLVDPSSETSGSAEALMALGLTPSEARIAAMVGTACPPTDAARRLGLTESTVRSAVAVIYGKLGLSRQSQLVRLVTRLA